MESNEELHKLLSLVDEDTARRGMFNHDFDLQGDDEGISKFLVLLFTDMRRLAIYTGYPKLGKWYSLALFLLGVLPLKDLDVSLRRSISKRLEVIALASLDDVGGVPNVSLLRSNYHRIGRFIRALSSGRSINAEIMMCTTQGEREQVLMDRGLSDFYQRAVYLGIYPPLSSFQVLMEVLKYDTYKTLDISEYYSLDSLKAEELEVLIEMGYQTPDLSYLVVEKTNIQLSQKTMQRLEEYKRVLNIKSIEDIPTVWNEMSYHEKRAVHSIYTVGELSHTTLGEIPVSIPNVNIALMKAGITELGLTGDPSELSYHIKMIQSF